MRLLIVCFLVHLVKCNNYSLSPELIKEVFGMPNDEPQQDVPVISNSALPANNIVVEQAKNERPLLKFNRYDSFDWTLTKRIAASSEENFLISPLGLKLAMAILKEAATGSTKDEISTVLGLDLNDNVVRQNFKTTLGSLQNKSTEYIFDLGSKIYVGSTVHPSQKFASISKEYYNTDITSLDFNNPALAADTINNWVANITNGRIPNLLSQDDVAGVVAMVLNTLFFKGSWTHQFSPNDTKPDEFYITPKHYVETPFMNTRDDFYCSDSVKFNAKILRLPYTGCKFSMYIVVPNSLTGLPHIFNNINYIRNELNSLTERKIDISLPKFKFEYTSVLDEVLKELGIRQAFEDTASLPGISRGQTLSQRLKISKVFQRSGIEVNEVGSIAYSATGIFLENKFGGEELVIANKPFLFFIQDDWSGQLLFTGRVANPTLSDGALKLK